MGVYPNGTLADYYGIVKRLWNQSDNGEAMSNPDDLEFLTKDANPNAWEGYRCHCGTFALFPDRLEVMTTPISPSFTRMTKNIERRYKMEYTFGEGPFTLPVTEVAVMGRLHLNLTLRVFSLTVKNPHNRCR